MKNCQPSAYATFAFLRCGLTVALALVTSVTWAQSQTASLSSSSNVVNAKVHAKLSHRQVKGNSLIADVQETPLDEVQMAVAKKVEVGKVGCEMGNSVEVVADPRAPGYFDVYARKFHFRMVPVVSSTGAIRLEDAEAGAIWLQLANKSMLMSQKSGSRLADACITPAQALVVAFLEKSPVPNLLDAVEVETPIVKKSEE